MLTACFTSADLRKSSYIFAAESLFRQNTSVLGIVSGCGLLKAAMSPARSFYNEINLLLECYFKSNAIHLQSG